MAETTLNKKMRAFDDEVAIAVAQLYLVHMLQRTPPGRVRRYPIWDFTGDLPLPPLWSRHANSKRGVL